MGKSSSEYNKLWRKKNKDRIKAYYKTHCKKRIQQSRSWRINNPDKVVRYKGRYLTEKKRAFDREYCRIRWKSDKKYRERMRHQQHLRWARKKGAVGFHTIGEWELLKKQYGFVCPCCKKPEMLTKDHIIPLTKGGSNYIENIQPLCRRCNAIKYTKVIKFINDYEIANGVVIHQERTC